MDAFAANQLSDPIEIKDLALLVANLAGHVQALHDRMETLEARVGGLASPALRRALSVLVDAHTREDGEGGFVVQMGGMRPCYPGAPAISLNDYTEAFATIRRVLGRPA